MCLASLASFALQHVLQHCSMLQHVFAAWQKWHSGIRIQGDRDFT